MTSRDTRWMTFVNPGFSSNQGDEGDRDAVIEDEPTEVHYGYEDSEVAFDHDLEEDHTFYRPKEKSTFSNRTCRISIIVTVSIVLIVIIAVVVLTSQQKSTPEELPENVCQEDTCSGNGNCDMVDDGPVCNCSMGYKPPDCSQRIGPCMGETCSHHGQCKELTDGEIACVCKSGFIGHRCEETDPCYSVTCINGGKCEQKNRTVVCQCPVGYFGSSCEIEACSASSLPCNNNGACILERNSAAFYRCDCKDHVGPHCETPYTEANQVAFYVTTNKSQKAELRSFNFDLTIVNIYLSFNWSIMCIPLVYKPSTTLNMQTTVEVGTTEILTTFPPTHDVSNENAYGSSSATDSQSNQINSTNAENAFNSSNSADSANSTMATKILVTTNSQNNTFSMTPIFTTAYPASTIQTTLLSGGNSSNNSISVNNSFSDVSRIEDCYYMSSFAAPENGYYWFFFTVVASTTNHVEFVIESTDKSMPTVGEIRRLHKTTETDIITIDTMSCSCLVNLAVGQELLITSNHPTFGNATIGSSWGGFLLNAFVSPLIVFDVVATSQSSSRTLFDKINLNEHEFWLPEKQQFVANKEGVYYFFLSISVSAYSDLTASIGSQCGLSYGDKSNIGVDIISRGCLLSLSVNDTISVSMSRLGDLTYLETGFRGFLYSPAHERPVAWSAHNYDLVTGSGTALNFPVVLVNKVAAWEANRAVVPVTGTYFIEMIGRTAANGSIDMKLMLNTNTLLTRLYFSGPASYVTRSRSVVVDLKLDDVLTVAYENVKMDGTLNNGISFQGMLLYNEI